MRLGEDARAQQNESVAARGVPDRVDMFVTVPRRVSIAERLFVRAWLYLGFNRPIFQFRGAERTEVVCTALELARLNLKWPWIPQCYNDDDVVRQDRRCVDAIASRIV